MFYHTIQPEKENTEIGYTITNFLGSYVMKTFIVWAKLLMRKKIIFNRLLITLCCILQHHVDIAKFNCNKIIIGKIATVLISGFTCDSVSS